MNKNLRRRIAVSLSLVLGIATSFGLTASLQGQEKPKLIIDNAQDVVEKNPLKPGETVSRVEVAKSDTANMRVVEIVEAKAHYHANYDEFVTVVSGKGKLTLAGGEIRDIKPGDIMFLPRGSEHAIIRVGNEKLIAVVVASPPADPKDIHMIEQKQ